jgi:CheY-like chemotaxis protein
MEAFFMENECSSSFDLPALLKIDCLDIRHLAKTNPSLRAYEYYALLARFINSAQHTENIITRIADLKAGAFDFRNMVIVRDMLKDIGCHKYTSAISDILSASKMGHNEFVVSCAKKLLKDFDDLYTHIMKAEKQPETETAPDASSNTDGSGDEYFASTFETFSLNKVLNMLEQEEATRKMRVLAIDDSPVMLQTISSVLSEDYIVYGMESPTMLEKFLQQITPELFLLDYKMPELSGFDLVPIIRNCEEHKNTPIVFLTSEGTTDTVSAAFTLGACDFIVKPFQANILREKVTKHIVRKNLLQKRAA